MKFAESLPRLRKTVEEHLSEPGLGHNKVMACVLKILSTCFIRPGSQVYADENGSYGIATLRRKHVTVKGDLVRFDFPGKRGVRQVREFKDRKIARIISELMKLPGHEVFKYEQDGSLVDVKRRDINQYIKEVMGDQFSSKDFRTWAGTLICACALARAGSDLDESKSARKKKVVSAIKETAEQLGNTPAICRSSYIYPGVLASYEKGIVVEKYFSSIEDLVSRKMLGLHPSEKSLLKLLKQKAA
jgi:DNA topoisomerase I